MDLRKLFDGMGRTAAVAAFLFLNVHGAQAGTLNIPDNPLFLNQAAAPLNLLVMGRDHKLYYEAYNDASDLDSDGDLDVGYRPDTIDYYGYFDSFACYDYDSGGQLFKVAFVNPSIGVGRTKKCAGKWSGDFLNYLTTSRMDAMRKVLYGGTRRTDTSSLTVLERSHLPQDAHSWGKEYESIARDGYDISEYSPLAAPPVNRRHLFANTTLLTDGAQRPRLRLVQNSPARVWNWLSKERPVADNTIDTVGGVTPTDYVVRVEVCDDGKISDAELPNCQLYPNGKRKPVGLLQKYGENDAMLFGLLTGSYFNNTEGGVLRKRVRSITDEINNTTDGTLRPLVGIIRTIDRLRVTGFGGSFEYNQNCGWIVNRPINAGECRMWGNPTAEMMYEALRYFAGRGATLPGATAAFATGGVGTDEATLGLPTATWNDPYSGAGANQSCAKPFMTVISDINPSFDTNALPGSAFPGAPGGMAADTGAMATFNATSSTQAVSAGEGDVNGTRRFIGEAIGNTPQYDGAPTPKIVGDLARIRGLSPEEPTKQGGYYAAGVAYFGNTTDVNPADGRQKVQTFAVALASPLPRIEIPFGATTVTLVPFAKSVGGLGINPAQAAFQPTNTIVDFYYDVALSNPPNRYFFRINYEDVEQGADHDMDAVVEYDVERTGPNTLSVKLNSTYAAGGIIQHMGYVISGTTNDGIYLDVRDADTGAGSDPAYFLDTPPGQFRTDPDTVVWNDGAPLPLNPPARTFTVGATPGATLLKDPLWYAAKWGGFVDSNSNDKPDLASEWNQDGDAAGTPDNYFLVTNALKLSEQLSKAFDEILKRATSASSVALNSGSLSSETRVYQAKFNSDGWTGQLLSFKIDPATGEVPATSEWDAAQKVPANSDLRTILSSKPDGSAIPFRWAQLDPTQQSLLDPLNDGTGDERLDYLRGSGALEISQPGGMFRTRSVKLGDIVSSSPVFVGPPRFFYRDSLETKPYSVFRAAKATRTPVVYAGANDGMLHGFHAGADAIGGGVELLSYVPRAVYRNLAALSSPTYQHKFFVDGSPTAVDAFLNNDWRTVLVGGLNAGGQSIYALDITDPATFAEGNADDLVLWEFDDRDTDGAGPDVAHPNLGLTYSRPLVVRLANGKWAAVFGNGYNSMAADGSASATGNAVLFVVDMETGQLMRRIDTGVGLGAPRPPGLSGKGNGLSSPAAVDLNADDIIDFVYAGDLYGNLWKFDFRSASPADWDVAYKSGSTNVPLFVATNDGGFRQSITSRPSIGRGPKGIGMVVLVGTGRYLELLDKDVGLEAEKTQSFYGLYDQNSGTSTDVIASRASLLQQRIAMEITEKFGDTTYTLRSTTSNTPVAQRGWFMDLKADQRTVLLPTPQVVAGPFEGEMQVSDSILRSGRILFTTLIPSQDPCAAGGTSWLMSLDALTGARIGVTQFDLNNDGKFDDADKAAGQPIPSGVKSGLGIVQKPGVLADNPNNQEFLYASGTSGDKPCGIAGAADGAADTDACRGLRSRFGPFDLGRQSWRQVR